MPDQPSTGSVTEVVTCRDCAAVHVTSARPRERPCAELRDREDFLVDGVEVTFRGRCPACTRGLRQGMPVAG